MHLPTDWQLPVTFRVKERQERTERPYTKERFKQGENMDSLHSLQDMSVENLSADDVSAALRQIISAPAFRPRNPHLSATEVAAILRGQWPNKPVFTPYAFTHHGYSQGRSASAGKHNPG